MSAQVIGGGGSAATKIDPSDIFSSAFVMWPSSNIPSTNANYAKNLLNDNNIMQKVIEFNEADLYKYVKDQNTDGNYHAVSANISAYNQTKTWTVDKTGWYYNFGLIPQDSGTFSSDIMSVNNGSLVAYSVRYSDGLSTKSYNIGTVGPELLIKLDNDVIVDYKGWTTETDTDMTTSTPNTHTRVRIFLWPANSPAFAKYGTGNVGTMRPEAIYLKKGQVLSVTYKRPSFSANFSAPPSGSYYLGTIGATSSRFSFGYFYRVTE